MTHLSSGRENTAAFLATQYVELAKAAAGAGNFRQAERFLKLAAKYKKDSL